MIRTDFHVHTDYSADSQASMESMIIQGITLGLEQICFTDHMDYEYPAQYHMDFTYNVGEALKQIEEYQEKYQGKILIRKGIELGLMPRLKSRYEDLLGRHQFDFVIGSTHIVDDYEPFYSEYWEHRTEEEGYRRYFEVILENMHAFQDFDTFGHIDYIVRYGPNKNRDYTYEKYADVLDEILKTLIHMDKALEINSAGYKYGLEQAHPQIDVLRRYKELGGERITIGSDAHRPEHLAYDFAKVHDVLKEIGFTQYTAFEDRKPHFIHV